ncbi:hypothetical protein BS50DRAFT_645593 [Corynespora cassiicola Philippines]|uniref:Uncharacterized protein n=1 Tax=Corynespora cassiicola Philippines TaxID=1448308 RepID=A0A2T2NJ10_CORCC|nr:hypothetical protein BS50DRAFT_645593 [Corynespora cassiicola Philippines]
MFRNENDVVAKKAKTRYQELSKQRAQKKGAGQAVDTPESNTSDSESSNLTSDKLIVPITECVPLKAVTRELMPSVEDQAVGFFFSNYVINPSLVPRGDYDFLYDLINKPDTPQILQSSLTAASLASMANATKSPAVMQRAQQDIGLRIFQQYYGVILTAALETKQPVPAEITRLWEKSVEMRDYKVHGKHWTVKMVRFMVDAINLAHDKTSDPQTIVENALAYDQGLDDIHDLVPNVWRYETLYLEKQVKDVYGNLYHVYLEPWILYMWNNLRTVRLILHGVIIQAMQRGAAQTPPLFPQEHIVSQIETSRQVMRYTATMVCASIPQINGQIPFPDLTSLQPSSEIPFTEIVDLQDPRYRLHPRGTFLKASRPTGMHHLVYPLHALGEHELCPPDLRLWIIDELQFIYSKIGARQALVFAEDLTSILKDPKGRGSRYL